MEVALKIFVFVFTFAQVHKFAMGISKDQARYLEALALRATRLGGNLANLKEEKVGSICLISFYFPLSGESSCGMPNYVSICPTAGWNHPPMAGIQVCSYDTLNILYGSIILWQASIKPQYF